MTGADPENNLTGFQFRPTYIHVYIYNIYLLKLHVICVGIRTQGVA